MKMKALQRRMARLLEQEGKRPEPVVTSAGEPSEEDIDRELSWYFMWATDDEMQTLDAIEQRRKDGRSDVDDEVEIDNICMHIAVRMQWYSVNELDPATLEVSR
ncbi:Uncharacterised protein [Burkholderia pseudomallei]|uniref:hypothetical protein n=1 Tax=Burkholderia pseudomallei TaxID=28450 RepID=UPI000F084619|nr:hypothetical protein [Burkholderia pseudomallei]VCT41731.1 Uncharacterised protein [Burkholderia pseudomallei]VCT44930.1 Uncharacterised protein [Burkholderia pseudomallei]VCT49839.1 Uncharacterised protein [Burkholderia pseudomallei]VCT59368.1 Uncharacterised protein [Burkholderia pseudomallei]VCT71466.1 Uncharacterised protein [Burkholderia pseudomallei]